MNLQRKTCFTNLHQDIAQTPHDHISTDLLGPHRLSYDSPLKDKKTMTVAIHLFSDNMLKFGFPRMLHSDNGMEFKSKLINHLSQQPGIIKTNISPHHLQAIRKLEFPHRFINDCILKFSIDGVLEWDQLLLYTTAAFSWFLNEHSQESPHFLYLGCDPYLPHLAAFLQLKLRHLGLDEGMICLDKLRQAYMLAGLNTKEACSKQNKEKYDDVPKNKTGDSFMIKNFKTKLNLDIKCIPNFRIVRLIGPRQLEISNLTGRLRKVNICNVHKILPSDFTVSSIPDKHVFGKRQVYK